MSSSTVIPKGPAPFGARCGGIWQGWAGKSSKKGADLLPRPSADQSVLVALSATALSASFFGSSVGFETATGFDWAPASASIG